MNNVREIIEELYRVDVKYWETGDIDILPKRTKLAQKINEEFYIELNGIMRIVTQKHYPVQTFIDILQMLGFDVRDSEVGMMIDREKVMQALAHHARVECITQNVMCPYWGDVANGCTNKLCADALELLKEQEAVEPNCRRKVKWE